MFAQMKKGMQQGLRGIGQAEKQLVRFEKGGCVVPQAAKDQISNMKEALTAVVNATSAEEVDLEKMQELGEGMQDIQGVFETCQAQMNLKPLQKNAAKVLKRWDAQCKKITAAAAKNANLGDVAGECAAALDAAKQAAAAGDAAAASDPAEAQTAYEAVFEYGEAIEHAQFKADAIKNARRLVAQWNRDVSQMTRKLKEASRKGFDVGNLGDGITALKTCVAEYGQIAGVRGADPDDIFEKIDSCNEIRVALQDGFDEVFGTQHEFEQFGVRGLEQQGKIDLGAGFNQILPQFGGTENVAP